MKYFALCAVFYTMGNILQCKHCVHSFALWVMFCTVCTVHSAQVGVLFIGSGL